MIRRSLQVNLVLLNKSLLIEIWSNVFMSCPRQNVHARLTSLACMRAQTTTISKITFTRSRKCHIPKLLNFDTRAGNTRTTMKTIKLPIYVIKSTQLFRVSGLFSESSRAHTSTMNRRNFKSLLFLGFILGAFAFLPPESVSFSPKTWSPRDFQRLEGLSLPLYSRGRPKPLAFSDGKGLVAGTSSAMAVHAGKEALRKGGNAMDACLTTALTGTTELT